jgi:hypothetical protein
VPPPKLYTYSELVEQMQQRKAGTDGTIPSHNSNAIPKGCLKVSGGWDIVVLFVQRSNCHAVPDKSIGDRVRLQSTPQELAMLFSFEYMVRMNALNTRSFEARSVSVHWRNLAMRLRAGSPGR